MVAESSTPSSVVSVMALPGVFAVGVNSGTAVPVEPVRSHPEIRSNREKQNINFFIYWNPPPISQLR
jgi:hypothetical protein